jgi:hypothetical protein
MVIAFICGGLGNQMFQYAMARRLAHRLGVELKLDLSEYQNGTDQRPAGLTAFRRSPRLFELCVTASAASSEEISRLRDPYSKRTTMARIVRRIRRVKSGFLWPATHIREKQYCFDPAMLELGDDVYVDGFWQSEKYFSDAAELIAAELTPKEPAISRYAHQYVERLRLLGGPVVSLHVRRGDLAEANEELGTPRMVYGAAVGLDYITAAIARFGGHGRFLVFSDTARDIEWCKRNIRADKLHFSEGHSDVQDMRIMSACDHHIIANSTFSWWAAWLNHRPGRRVVSPAKWSYPEAAVHMVTDDLIPSGWEVI